ncbi:aldo/keto reductase [Bdellovibrio sp. NC01]|uniref:aldo/keto reductase n=1 Tax=Bdellovibrio sp. NC01 TaxID=2220073 RepID=UPI00115A9DE3|nr:aldo/keto reductase [Bdellovibrio sp. NC01]QDK38042.1 aldo/keto reductase [Bdellovibrio sp. NC01]
MSNVPSLKLNDGKTIPQLGFGLWQVPDAEAETAVLEAIKVGYRSIDGAAIYRNEDGLGRAIQNSSVKREELFITTKLWNENQGYDSTLSAFEQSMKKLKLDYLDMYLIHWPSPHRGLFVDTWKALIQLRKEGRVKTIGVSNFTIDNLKKIIAETGEVPAVNQIELHPNFQQKELRKFHAEKGIATESWSPLGQGKILQDATLSEIAAKHGKSVAQIILRWHLQSGLIVIPKSVTPSRIKENFDVFGFTLDNSDMEKIAKMDSAEGRIGPNPETAAF